MEKHTCTFCNDHSGNNDATVTLIYIYAGQNNLIANARKACGRCVNAIDRKFGSKGKVAIIDTIEIKEVKTK